MTLKVVCFSLRKTVLSQIINMSIVDLYSEMLKEHKKIIDGHSEICKKNSLQCLIFVFERNKNILEEHFDYPS